MTVEESIKNESNLLKSIDKCLELSNNVNFKEKLFQVKEMIQKKYNNIFFS